MSKKRTPRFFTPKRKLEIIDYYNNHNLEQQEVARHFNISKANLCRWNKGRKKIVEDSKNPLLDSLENYCKIHPKFSHLLRQWHPDNPPMSSFPVRSFKRVKWRCEKCPFGGKHEWSTRIQNRTGGKRQDGCPYCCTSGTKKICPCINHCNSAEYFCKKNGKSRHLPDEWHTDNPRAMNTYTPSSSAKVKWRCKPTAECKTPCGMSHEWVQCVGGRVPLGRKCKICLGQKVCPCGCNSAFTFCSKNEEYKHLIDQWHPENLPMKDYMKKCPKNVKWICKNAECGTDHVWTASLLNRVLANSGCPYCSNWFVCPCGCDGLEAFCHENEEYKHLISEWDPSNGDMKTFTKATHKIVKWRCNKGHSFKQIISYRTRGGGCPTCSQTRGEMAIDNAICELGFKGEFQKKFDRCKDKRKLPFDNSISANQRGEKSSEIMFEYDGKQHFVYGFPCRTRPGWKIQRVHDIIKNKFCLENNKLLVRIAYCDFPFIRNIIESAIEKAKRGETGIIFSNPRLYRLNALVGVMTSRTRPESKQVYAEKNAVKGFFLLQDWWLATSLWRLLPFQNYID